MKRSVLSQRSAACARVTQRRSAPIGYAVSAKPIAPTLTNERVGARSGVRPAVESLRSQNQRKVRSSSVSRKATWARDSEAMLGDESAKALHLHPGELLHVGKRAFRIAGIYHSGDRFVDLGAVLPLKAVQAIAQRPNEITTIGVTVDTSR